MKHIFYILFLLPLLSFSQVGFSTYGIVGNGSDETTKLQTALDSGNDLINDVGSNFLISTTLDIDQTGDQTINWSSAIITSVGYLQPMMEVAKLSGGGITTMMDLHLDGSNGAQRGIEFRSPGIYTNITTSDYAQTTNQSIIGIWIDITTDSDSWGKYTFEGCDTGDMDAVNNNTVATDVQGAAYGLYVTWDGVPGVATIIDYNNALLYDTFGEDANCVFVRNGSGIYDIENSSSSFNMTDCILRDGERRVGKLFSGGATYTRCLFQEMDKDNPRALSTQGKAGLLAIDGYNNGGTKFIDCEFRGTTGTTNDNRMFHSNSNDSGYENCRFTNGTGIYFSNVMGAISVCGTEFGAGSYIEDKAGTDWTGGSLTLDTGNIYTDEFSTMTTELNNVTPIQIPLVCTIITPPSGELSYFSTNILGAIASQQSPNGGTNL